MVSTYQIVLGTTSLEITPEEVALNASELIPKSQISGVFPMTFQERQVGDTDWTYPYDTITRITIYLKNGRKLEVELQSITNQSGWSGGTLADLQQAINDINPWLQTSTPPVAIGTIFDETQSNGTSYDGFNAAQWNVKGSPVLTFTTGNIQITTSAANYWPDGIIYKRWVTNLQNFKQGAVIQYPSLAGTGCAISMQTTDSTTSTYTLLAGSGGKIWLFNNKTLVAQTSFGFFNINAGDSLMMEFEKINGTLKCNVQNLTIPLSPVMTLTYNYAFTYPFSNVMPLAQRLAVVPWNGTYNIKSFYLNTTDKKNIDALFITDSKGIGYFANTFANQFSEQLATANPTKFISNSGTADETVAIDVIPKLPELVLINAKKYFLYIGCNDLRYGLISSLQANLTTVKNTLEAIGATVYFIESTPESGAGSINSTTVNNVASLVFASPNILPAYALFETTPGSGTPNPTLYSPDTIHPNLAGQTVLKNLIQPYL